ncbi:HeH/LEM domain-containing protein [Lactobacillus intestinalis]|uniref:HeH/LEM domain-containing protein n=1 Tax=Lactobacillus intestinalis TaxID=151781 RepID=UPI00346443D8
MPESNSTVSENDNSQNINSSKLVPTADNTIPEIKAYLDKNNISYPANANKSELLALISNKK